MDSLTPEELSGRGASSESNTYTVITPVMSNKKKFNMYH